MLKLLAKLIYLKHKPKIIIVAGTSGKTLTLSIINHIIKDHFTVFQTSYHKNHLLGAILTFLLSDEEGFLNNFFKGLKLLISKFYPEYLLIEFGPERPKVIKRYFSWLKIKILVITSFGKIPAFVEYFAGPEKLLDEYKDLISLLKTDGVCIINSDDMTLVELKNKIFQQVLTFSLKDGDVYAENEEFVCNFNNYPVICGTKFNLVFGKKTYPVFMKYLFGKGIIYSSLAAFLVAKLLNIKEEEIINDIESFSGIEGRGIIKRLSNGILVLDNSQHVSLASVQYSLEIIKKINRRKILVLGDILHLGELSYEAHSLIGEKANFVDIFIAYGPRAIIAAESAIKNGLEESRAVKLLHLDYERLLEFLRENLKPEDAVLINGDPELKLNKLIDDLENIFQR